MKRRISDLVDGCQAHDLELFARTPLAPRRIKELTMKKIDAGYRPKRLSFRLLVAAAIIAALGIPVLAASGIRYSDWLENWKNTGTGQTFDEDPLHGGSEKRWMFSDWVFEIRTEEASSTGMTICYAEVGAGEKGGTLTAKDDAWLEKWDGEGYVPIDGTIPVQETIRITPGSSQIWTVDWQTVHGQLSSGSYRLGRTFVYSAEGSAQEDMVYYAKFRVFSQEVGAAVETCMDAVEQLHSRESYHLVRTYYYDKTDDFGRYYTEEVWKSGNHFLQERRYYNADGSLKSRNGTMLRDGVGYTLEWAGDSVLSGLADWEKADWMDPTSFDYWLSPMDVIDSLVGEVSIDGNVIEIFEYHNWKDETTMTQEQIDKLEAKSPLWNHDYTRYCYTFDDHGNLTDFSRGKMLSLDPETADLNLTDTVEVFDTGAEEIASVIAAQNVDTVRTFSWEEEYAAFQESGFTDGFHNTKPTTIKTAEDAEAVARKECDVSRDPTFRAAEYNLVKVSYDGDAQMWKVEFGYSQGNETQTIYLDSEGITRLVTVEQFSYEWIKNMTE